MDHSDEVERFSDCVLVSDLLIATVSLVELVPENGYRNLWMGVAVLTTDRKGTILAGIVDDQNLRFVCGEDPSGTRWRTWRRLFSAYRR